MVRKCHCFSVAFLWHRAAPARPGDRQHPGLRWVCGASSTGQAPRRPFPKSSPRTHELGSVPCSAGSCPRAPGARRIRKARDPPRSRPRALHPAVLLGTAGPGPSRAALVCWAPGEDTESVREEVDTEILGLGVGSQEKLDLLVRSFLHLFICSLTSPSAARALGAHWWIRRVLHSQLPGPGWGDRQA